jgi:hypothetical protein
VLDRIQDQAAVVFDRLGELDERLEAGASRPGDPAAQQPSGIGQLDGLEDRPELLLEQVGPVEPAVGFGDPSKRGALVAGQVRRIFQQRPPGVLECGGLIVVPIGAQPRDHPAAHLVEGFGGPGHDMERIQAQRRGGGAGRDHVVDPLGAVGGNVTRVCAGGLEREMSDRLTGDVHAAVARGLEGVDLGTRPRRPRRRPGRIRHAAAPAHLQGTDSSPPIPHRL